MQGCEYQFERLLKDLRLSGSERDELEAVFDEMASTARNYSLKLSEYEDKK